MIFCGFKNVKMTLIISYDNFFVLFTFIYILSNDWDHWDCNSIFIKWGFSSKIMLTISF
jgi:hypothetical protein